jgi:hypothetical protein
MVFGWFRRHGSATIGDGEFAERSSSAMSVDGELHQILRQACHQQMLMEEYSMLERRWMQSWCEPVLPTWCTVVAEQVSSTW